MTGASARRRGPGFDRPSFGAGVGASSSPASEPGRGFGLGHRPPRAPSPVKGGARSTVEAGGSRLRRARGWSAPTGLNSAAFWFLFFFRFFFLCSYDCKQVKTKILNTSWTFPCSSTEPYFLCVIQNQRKTIDYIGLLIRKYWISTPMVIASRTLHPIVNLLGNILFNVAPKLTKLFLDSITSLSHNIPLILRMLDPTSLDKNNWDIENLQVLHKIEGGVWRDSTPSLYT
jgi:hypothetical protein